MFKSLFLLFLFVPLVEIYLLIKVGGILGAGFTLVLLVAAAIAGTFLLRAQSVSTLIQVRGALARGELPARELVEGVIILVAGVLLLTPGFFTDCVAILGLIPALRARVAHWVLGQFVRGAAPGADNAPRRPGPRTLEGDFHRE